MVSLIITCIAAFMATIRESAEEPKLQEEVVKDYGNLNLNSPAGLTENVTTSSFTPQTPAANQQMIPASSNAQPSSSSKVISKPVSGITAVTDFLLGAPKEKEDAKIQIVNETAENYTSPNKTQQIDDVLSKRLNNKKSKKLLEELLPASVPQNTSSPDIHDDADPSASTFLLWQNNEFIIQKEGSKDSLVFVIEKQAHYDSTRKELPNCKIIWSGKDFFLKPSDAVEEEKIYGMKIISSSKRIILITTCILIGDLSRIQQLENSSSAIVTQNVTPQDLVNFLSNCKINDEKQNYLKKKKTAAVVDQKGKAADETAISKKSKPGKAKLVKASVLENEAINNFEKRIAEQQLSLPKPEIKNIRIDLLHADTSIREVSRTNIDALKDQMRKQLWQNSINFFIVVEDENRYFVLDGNNRLMAFKEFNAETEDSQQFKTVKCHVYQNPDFNQVLLLTSPRYNDLPHENLTILELASLTLKIIQRNRLTIPSSIKAETAFTKLMQSYINANYSPVVTQLIRLPPNIITSIMSVKCKDISIIQIDLPATFWKTFIQAFKKNEEESMEALKALGDKTKKEVEKLLKRVERNVLTLISEKCNHEYTDEKELIKYICGDREISRKSFLDNLKLIGFNKNRKRKVSATGYLENLRKKMDSHFTKNALYKNANFQKSIDDSTLLKQNVIITQNLSQAFLTKLKEVHNKCIILLLSNYGERAASLPQSIEPDADDDEHPECIRAAVIDFLIDEEVEIDQTDSIPVTTIKSSIYLPHFPQRYIANPPKYLLEMAKKNGCSIAQTMGLRQLYNLAKISPSTDSILLSHTSEKITKQLLNDLGFFKNIIVTGDEKLNDLVTFCTAEDEEDEKQTIEENEGKSEDEKQSESIDFDLEEE